MRDATDDVVAYLASIDWLAAAVVATVLIVIGAVLLRFLMASSSEVGRMIPGARDAAGRMLLDARHDMPLDAWVCTVCHSVNVRTAEYCYRGCGQRDGVAQTPVGRADTAD